jgi:hypothetical protein
VKVSNKNERKKKNERRQEGRKEDGREERRLINLGMTPPVEEV